VRNKNKGIRAPKPEQNEQKLRILILEDTAADAALVERRLLEGGILFSSKLVDTREAFIKELKDFSPDLILSDHSLPQFDGLSALEIVQTQYPEVPFIFVTGAMGEEWAIESLKKGAIDYVLKDKLSRLVPVVNRALKEVKERNERKQVEEELKRIEWLLTKSHKKKTGDYAPVYGNLLELNTSRFILDSVGEGMLSDIVSDYLDLLDTSAAIYEKNGDYALGIFSSGWCRFMDQASRDLCGTDDNHEALVCGKWLCHESCWSDVSKKSIGTNGPVDIECNGGIQLYAIPIKVNDEVVGSINFGYGDPPRDPVKLQELAVRYNVKAEELVKIASVYESRPKYFVDLAKRRLHVSARLIGQIIERKQAEEKLKEMHMQQKAILDNIPDIAWLKDKESKFIAVNEPFGRSCGVSPENLKGKTDLDIWPVELAKKYRADDKEVMEKRHRKQVEELLVDKDGNKTWIETIKTPIYNDRDELIGTTGIARDITERKRAENEIKKRVKELEDFYEISIQRELKMIELKNQIEELTNKLAKYEKI
jgi:PAS domain S-box-containing protein